MDLDMRTAVAIGSGVTFAMVLYLSVVWIRFRREFHGIGLSLLGMVALILGSLGLNLLGSLSPWLSIVLGNTVIVAGGTLTVFGLYRFLGEPMSRAVMVIVVALPMITLVEQVVFGVVSPNLPVRIVTVSAASAVVPVINFLLLFRHRRRTSLPGALLMTSFAVQALSGLGRIPMSFGVPLDTSLLGVSGYQALAVGIWVIALSAWPIGFSLLIAHEFQRMTVEAGKERTALLQELNHRTRNNLTLAISLFEWQRTVTRNPRAEGILQVMEDRLHAISIVHRLLYESENLAAVPMRQYVPELVGALVRRYKENDSHIDTRYELDDVSLVVDSALPAGLILNELIANALRHAIPKVDKGEVIVSVKRSGAGRVAISVSDNGPGLSPDSAFADNGEGIGLRMARLLAFDQLHGELKLGEAPGFCCTVDFPESQPHAEVSA